MSLEFDGIEMTLNCGPCHKCGEHRSDTRLVRLIGDFEAILCVRCGNAWTEYIKPHKACLALDYIADERRCILAQVQADGEDRSEKLNMLSREVLDLETELFAAAKAWVAERSAST